MQSDCKMTITLLQNKTGKQSDNTHFVFLFNYLMFECIIGSVRTSEHLPICCIKHTFGGYSQAWDNGQT